MIRRSALGALTPLSKGGTARVYRAPALSLPGVSKVIYKEYSPSIREKAGPSLLPGLLALVRFRARLPANRMGTFDERIIWPLGVVTDPDGAALGIVMREIPGEFFTPKGDPREAHLLFQADGDLRALGHAPWSMETRIEILARAATVYWMLHRLDVIFGDVSPRNLVLTAGTSPRVMGIDTDSVRLRFTRAAFGAQPHTPAWEPPEAQRAERLYKHAKRSGASAMQLQEFHDAWIRQTTQTDAYKFGLMVVRILDYGRNRSQNRSPDRACQVLRSHLGRQVADMLRATVGDDPSARPTMREWFYALQGKQSPPQPPRPRASGRTPGPPAPPPQPVAGWTLVPGTGWVRDTP